MKNNCVIWWLAFILCLVRHHSQKLILFFYRHTKFHWNLYTRAIQLTNRHTDKQTQSIYTSGAEIKQDEFLTLFCSVILASEKARSSDYKKLFSTASRSSRVCNSSRLFNRLLTGSRVVNWLLIAVNITDRHRELSADHHNLKYYRETPVSWRQWLAGLRTFLITQNRDAITRTSESFQHADKTCVL